MGKFAVESLDIVLKVHGLVTAREVAKDIVDTVNADLVRDGVQFCLCGRYVEVLNKLALAVRRYNLSG